MGNINIVEYNDRYAASLAEMWNLSGDNWGGDDKAKTEEDMKKEVANSSDLKLYLALDGEIVVGSCSFSEYKYDENTSYIPLLNVRPDYHGKKVGKLLVQKVVETAVESKWPRLDLFTWPGNTKAVPLYKKCGFFWEAREDEAHLMNFIPYVMKTEAVEELFKDKIHWYDSSVREIEVKRDGIKSGEFQFYEYSWKSEEASLRMQFERLARGLTLIETDDYLIRVFMDNQKLIFGKEYEVNYEVINKSGKKLEIEIEGLNHKSVRFNFKEKFEVDNKEIKTAKFYLDRIEKDTTINETHPGVCSNLKINGKRACMILGIHPKFPVNIKVNDSRDQVVKGEKGILYIDLESNFEEDVQLKFSLPENEFVDFQDKDMNIYFKEKERRSIKVEYLKKKDGYLKEKLDINIKTKGEEIVFQKEIAHAFMGKFGKFYGECEGYYDLINGSSYLRLEKQEKEAALFHCGSLEQEDYILTPEIGKPFSVEFHKKDIETVDFTLEENAVSMRIYMKSEEFTGVTLEWVMRLYDHGITENYYEISSDKDRDKEIHVAMSSYFHYRDAYMPIHGKIARVNDDFHSNVDNWRIEDLDENWIFCKKGEKTSGLIWGEGISVSGEEWFILGDVKFDSMVKGKKYRTPSAYYMYNTIGSLEEFRKLALSKNGKETKGIEKLEIVEPTEIEINGGNPFVENIGKIKIIQHKNVKSEGCFKLNVLEDNVHEENMKISYEESYEKTFELSDKVNKISSEVQFEYDLVEREAVIFKSSDEEIKKTTRKEAGYEIMEIDNGEIKFRVSPEYSFDLISLERNGEEWMDSIFPKIEPKGWFNPYTGGISIIPDKLTNASILKEKTHGEFVNIKDNFSNEWEGIKLTLTFEENKNYKGLIMEQFFLTMKGVPVMAVAYKLINNSGKYMYDELIYKKAFLKLKEDRNIGEVILKDHRGKKRKYRIGSTDMCLYPVGGLAFKRLDKDEMLNIHCNGKFQNLSWSDKNFITANNPLRLWMEDKEILNPVTEYYIFNDEFIERESLKDLDKIKFNI